MSTPCFEIRFRMLQKMRSIQDNEVLMMFLGLSKICLYPADDERLSISKVTGFVISLLLHLEHLALKSLSSFMLPKGLSRFVQKYSNSS